jgi:TIR domain
MLEAEGWSVWWDTSLAAADLYRDEIMKQLALARAVITIWTPNSIRSDWVRAEAGTAKKEGKLIPVKTPDVAYADIPLPFGEMHTENLEASQLIRAAVVAQLAKPAVEPTAVALLTKGFKWEVLTWWGIIGGAVTLFGAISALLKLADWAGWLVQGWKEWTRAFWHWTFGWLGVHLPPPWTAALSFLLFWSVVTIGQAVKFKSATKLQTSEDRFQERSFDFPSWRSLACVAFMLLLPFLWVFIMFVTPPLRDLFPEEKIEPVGLIVSFVGFAIALVVPVLVFARLRWHAAVATCLMVIFFRIIIASSLPQMLSVVITFLVLLPILLMVMLSVAPAKAVSRRLIFLAIGLLLLIALNELSKLGLDVTAPKHG